MSSETEPTTSPAVRHVALGSALLAAVARRPADAEAARELQEAAGRLAAGDAHTAVRVLDLVGRALDLAETVRPTASRAALGHVAAAAEALRAAVGTARVDVEVALADVTDPAEREELLTAIEPVDDVVLRAAKLTALVREQIPR